MIDIGWSELLVIGVVALIVVGPKDLPIMFRRMGEFTGKARAMAREFTRAMDKAADEAGVKDVQKDLKNIANPKQMGLDAIKDATGDLANIERDSNSIAGKPSASPARGPETTTHSEPSPSDTTKTHDPAAEKPKVPEAAAAEPQDLTDEKPA